jgi:ribonucleoside-diphosphate reductase alpha chain
MRQLAYEKLKNITDGNYIAGASTADESEISYYIWNKKYRIKNETADEYFTRIANAVFSNEREKINFLEILKEAKIPLPSSTTPETFHIDTLKTFSTIPAGRIQYAAGSKREKTTLSNCFVLPNVPDSMQGIVNTLSNAAITMKAGGGIGYNFGTLRPKNSVTLESIGTSSGPISFMKMFDAMCETIESAGGRRGAQIAVFPIWHPDIEEFITAKQGNINKALKNFNISVAVDDEFMLAVKEDLPYDLAYPNYVDYKKFYDEYWQEAGTLTRWMEIFNAAEVSDGKNPSIIVYRTVSARELWDKIIQNAYKFSEPGVLFIDTVNNNSPINYIEYIFATNPCVVGDTKIQTVEGLIEIKDLVGKNIDVYCMDNDGQITISSASNIVKTRSNAELIAIKTTRDTLTCTPDHKIYTKNKGYVCAEDLEVTDKIVGGDLNLDELEILAIDKLDYVADVYDMSVDKYHNFIANGLVIHNCGEQPLPGNGSCNLKHVNLTKIVKKPFADIVGSPRYSDILDFDMLNYLTAFSTYFLDRVLDINYYPLEEQKTYELRTRVIGTGFTGYADMLAMIGMPYEDSEHVIRVITQSMANTAYYISSLIAKRKGVFPDFNYEEFIKTDYYRHVLDHSLSSEARTSIKTYGLRNGRLLTIAPVGTTSLLAGNLSSGIEPMFDLRMERTIIENAILGTTRKVSIPDFAVLLYKEIQGIDLLEMDFEELPVAFKSLATRVLPEDHLRIQAACQEYIDGSISKTIQIPTATTFEEVKSLYTLAHELGIKGTTIFRENEHMTGILQSTSDKPKEKVLETPQIVIPKKLDSVCPSVRIRLKEQNNEKVYINISYDPVTKKPLEVFASLPKGIGELNGKFFSKLYFERKNQWEISCRLISLLLRTELEYSAIKKQISKGTFSNFDISSLILAAFESFEDFIGSSILIEIPEEKSSVSQIPTPSTNPCPECGGNMIRKDGCKICTKCGYSPCDA